MSEKAAMRLSWVFVGVVAITALVLFGSGVPASEDDDHERAESYRRSGEIVPLSQLLQRSELAGQRILEAELEDEHGRLVYELEILHSDGRVTERYYDAATGEPIDGKAGR